MTPSSRLHIGLFFAGLLLAVTAAGQTPPDAVLAELGDDDFAVRQAATARLLTDDTLTPEALAAWSDRDLSLEQQHRLLEIAEHHTLRQMRLTEFPAEGPGSIGVVQSAEPLSSIADPTLNLGVRITKILPGFPGMGRLYIGDRIVAINGTKIEEGQAKTELFQARMAQFVAGDVIQLSIARDGDTIEVKVPLVNLAALPQMYPKENPKNNQFKLAPRFVEGWQEERRTRFAALAPQLLDTTP